MLVLCLSLLIVVMANTSLVVAAPDLTQDLGLSSSDLQWPDDGTRTATAALIGRKRLIVTDTLGLLLTVAVTAASVHDSAAGTHLLSQVREHHPTITKAWADNGYKTKAVEHAAEIGIDLEIVQRDPALRGFRVQPRRWVIERTLGWLMHHRRLARDYETHPHRSAAMIQLAAINLMTRRLTHETTTNWRDS
ncbi:hypothetical protein ALMP_20680 [Streptomyces sp. A012304]|nr:hypothetical protein ALMP_20680 [Streptomyces sp. A012304]